MANYINNKDLLEAIKNYQKKCLDAENSGEDKPQVPNYIGECILQIAERYATKHRFRRYSFKEEMIGARSRKGIA